MIHVVFPFCGKCNPLEKCLHMHLGKSKYKWFKTTSALAYKGDNSSVGKMKNMFAVISQKYIHQSWNRLIA